MTNTKYGPKAGIVLSLDEMMTACAMEDETGTTEDVSEHAPSHGIRLEEIGLSMHATLGEIREAVRIMTLENLGLPDGASDEELMEAAKAQRELDLAKAIEAADYVSWRELVMQDPDSAGLAEKTTEEIFRSY